MAEQLENKASEAEKLGEQNLRLQSRISELKIMLEKREKEIFILTKKLEDNSSESLSGVKNLTAQKNNLLLEKETLQAEKALLKENFTFEGDEASNQVQRLMDEANTLQQQLESLHIQKAKLELQFERKKQKSSERLNKMENQKSKLKQMVEDLQRDLEAKGDEKNDLVNKIIRECLKNKSLQHASQGGVLEIGLHAACEFPTCQEAAGAMHAAVKKRDQNVVLLPGKSIEQVAVGPNFASSDKSIDETTPTIVETESFMLWSH
ncbi:hypothetical protein PVK06_026929 [Gossypium arboreum]|uniref:Uncharacterized protein n=1 Tax=Gossypium arboreum TaxID=29729 RepID=A0ABR0NYX3_GOSAR|nr:hypothetical protein PVK06_026929 [Gossypium arboreum]